MFFKIPFFCCASPVSRSFSKLDFSVCSIQFFLILKNSILFSSLQFIQILKNHFFLWTSASFPPFWKILFCWSDSSTKFYFSKLLFSVWQFQFIWILKNANYLWTIPKKIRILKNPRFIFLSKISEFWKIAISWIAPPKIRSFEKW